MAIQEPMGDRAYWERNNSLRKFPNRKEVLSLKTISASSEFSVLRMRLYPWIGVVWENVRDDICRQILLQ